MAKRGAKVAVMAITAVLLTACWSQGADLGLIEPAVLSDQGSRWVVLDARPRADWAKGHIPGARSFSWEDHTGTDERGIRYRVLPPVKLAAELAALGIDERTPVVIYGDADRSWGGEGWDAWVLAWLGHQGPVRLLDGGIQAWMAKNLPLSKGEQHTFAKKRQYRVHLQPQLDVSSEELEHRQGNVSVVDVRSTWEWIRGRIPGAVHIPWDDFFTGKERRPLPAPQLKKLLAEHGVDASKPVVYYCLGGMRSGYAWMVHELAGLPGARNYEGGMAAWQKRGTR